MKKCCTRPIWTYTGGLIWFYIVIWAVLSQFKWALLFLDHAWRGCRTRLSIRQQDPNDSSDTETRCLVYVTTHIFSLDWLAKSLQRNLGFEACKPILTMYMMLKNGLIISIKHHNLKTRIHSVQSTRLWVWGKPAHTSWPWVRSACKFRTCHLSGPHKATPSPVHRRLPQITPWGETRTFHLLCLSF